MPVELKINNRIFKAGWCQDLMILPEFRNVGVGYFLIKYMQEEAKGLVEILLSAGTNRNSYALLANLGFTDVGYIGCSIKPVNTEKIVSVLLRGTPFSGMTQPLVAFMANSMAAGRRLAGYFYEGSPHRMEISRMTDFGRDLDSFWIMVSKDIPCLVKRDSKTMTWRFQNNPRFNYVTFVAREEGAIKGYIVLREGGVNNPRFEGLRAGVISDLLFDRHDKGIGSALFDAAIGYFKDKADLIRCDILDEEVRPLLRAKGFFDIKSDNRFLICPLQAEKPSLVRGAWHITYGDADLDLF